MSDYPTLIARHKGPFLFQIYRPTGRPGFGVSSTLPKEVDRDSVMEEALAILQNPQDPVDGIGLWSIPEEQFVTLIRIEHV